MKFRNYTTLKVGDFASAKPENVFWQIKVNSFEFRDEVIFKIYCDRLTPNPCNDTFVYPREIVNRKRYSNLKSLI